MRKYSEGKKKAKNSLNQRKKSTKSKANEAYLSTLAVPQKKKSNCIREIFTFAWSHKS